MLSWENKKYYIFWVCVCSFRYQHTMRMRRIILSSVACLALSYFSIFHKRHDFRKNIIENKVRVLIFPMTFVQNISHSQKNWARYYQTIYIYIYIYLHVKWPLFLSDIKDNWILSTDLKKKCSITKFHENPSNGSRFFFLCGRTDMLKPIGTLRDFSNSPSTTNVSNSQIFLFVR